MVIGVISDSHDNVYALRRVLRSLLERNVKLVIHLGDIISPFTVKLMREILGGTTVIAVRGNNDGDLYQLVTLFAQYNWIFRAEPGVVELGCRKAFILHGYGGINETLSVVNALVKTPSVELVLFGHTHKALVEKNNGKLVLNPGEVCGYISGQVSYALVDLDSLDAEIVFLEGEP